MTPRLLVVDEAQNLNRECIEFLRYLGEDPARQGAMLLVGGDGCWEVLSREPMLRSRVFRRVAFAPLAPAKMLAAARMYHPLYCDVTDGLLELIDCCFAHGYLRNWARFTLTAIDLMAEARVSVLDEQVVRNVFALFGGGVDAA